MSLDCYDGFSILVAILACLVSYKENSSETETFVSHPDRQLDCSSACLFADLDISKESSLRE